MSVDLFDPSRRRLMATSLGLGGALAAAPLLPAAAATPPSADLAALDTPAENVRTMARLTSTLEPGKQGYVRYTGRAYALHADGKNQPMYGIDGIGALRALPQPDGSIRFLFSEFAIYTDLATGKPLERWTNPLGREVEVWHQRNGPVNYTLDPAKAMFGAFARSGPPVQGFQLPWTQIGPFASFAIDAAVDRKNPLSPEEWPLESTGETLPTTEHSQYAVLLSDLADRDRPTLPFFASLQSLKPWHPWMAMGRTPGRVFARLVAQRVSGPEVLPPATLAVAERQLGAFMQAPESWTGAYKTAHAIYKETRTPLR